MRPGETAIDRWTTAHVAAGAVLGLVLPLRWVVVVAAGFEVLEAALRRVGRDGGPAGDGRGLRPDAAPGTGHGRHVDAGRPEGHGAAAPPAPAIDSRDRGGPQDPSRHAPDVDHPRGLFEHESKANIVADIAAALAGAVVTQSLTDRLEW